MKVSIISTKRHIEGITSTTSSPDIALVYPLPTLESLLHSIMLFYVYILNVHCPMARPLEPSNAVVSVGCGYLLR